MRITLLKNSNGFGYVHESDRIEIEVTDNNGDVKVVHLADSPEGGFTITWESLPENPVAASEE